jgi:hypothetical protein
VSFPYSLLAGIRSALSELCIVSDRAASDNLIACHRMPLNFDAVKTLIELVAIPAWSYGSDTVSLSRN